MLQQEKSIERKMLHVRVFLLVCLKMLVNGTGTFFHLISGKKLEGNSRSKNLLNQKTAASDIFLNYRLPAIPF